MLPLSSFEANHAHTQLLAARLALEEAEQAGLPFTTTLEVRDDAYDKEKAARIAEEFVADPSIVSVVGPMNSDMSLASGPIFHEAGLAHIATASSNATLTRRGWKTFFRMVPSDDLHIRDAAAFAVRRLGARRIAIVQDGSNWSRPVGDSFKEEVEALGAVVPAYVPVQRKRREYGDAVRALAAANADLLFFAVIEEVAVIIARELREAGVRAPFFAPNGLKPPPYFATPDYDVDGPYYTNVTADHRVLPRAGEMVKRYVARFQEQPTVYVAEAYDATGILLRAIRAAGASQTHRPSRDEVLRAVAGIRGYEGTSGTISFDANGEIENRGIGIYKYEAGQLRFLGFTTELDKMNVGSPAIR
jgi:branched-chain amino acid transport system substrate-binding protein